MRRKESFFCRWRHDKSFAFAVCTPMSVCCVCVVCKKTRTPINDSTSAKEEFIFDVSIFRCFFFVWFVRSFKRNAALQFMGNYFFLPSNNIFIEIISHRFYGTAHCARKMVHGHGPMSILFHSWFVYRAAVSDTSEIALSIFRTTEAKKKYNYYYWSVYHKVHITYRYSTVWRICNQILSWQFSLLI